ncbi:hypothetical protein BASA50_003269 [Batrachochytrium salamandrivorans]|uniref:26S proteasome non-ATPase regulatory subunit 5 n=1 Tax=Batrachochytrium salamandrivorans TaxID=1357716 RepID=A0ABQ8FIY3_9FUNG|nr:hypothetical protein BASA61_003593 [Batrachochytrium salamandrivorans]KAH6599060.1 hypothetical protein BASA50_003269 [Batrachochytrium salamandrivorans]KAH9265953.1 hypothetical protein BASA83_010861 [Batrachochytrium salamandrivorans]
MDQDRLSMENSSSLQDTLLASTQTLSRLAANVTKCSPEEEQELTHALTVWKTALNASSAVDSSQLSEATVLSILLHRSPSPALVELCCDVLDHLLAKLPFASIMGSYKDLLQSGIESKLPPIHRLVLNILQRALDRNSDLQALINSDLLTQLITAIAVKDSQMAKKAGAILTQLGSKTMALDALLSPDHLALFESLAGIDAVVKLRIYDLFASISMSSQAAFDYCAQNGVLAPLSGVVFGGDLLESLNVLEILTSFAETSNGYLFLEKTGVMDQMFNALQSSPQEEDIVHRLAIAATIKFWGLLLFHQHEHAEAIQARFDLLGALQPFLEESGDDIKDAIFVANANLGSKAEGVHILFQQRIHLDTLLAMYRSSIGDAKISLLRTYSCLLGVNSQHNSQLEEETLYIFEKLKAHGLGFKELMHLTKSTIEDLSTASFAVINGVLGHSWGIEQLAQSADLSQFVVLRQQGAQKLSMEWKMALVRTILDNPATPLTLGGLLREKLDAYRQQGVYYTEMQPIVAMESA